ncbi:MAG: hypothetical protein LQ347_002300 [Umbilicaria vellea]|nr:MAG: hypothetical protein LQ347_002300 [Umbilicaria vellea]
MASAPEAQSDITSSHAGSSSDEGDNDVVELDYALEIDTDRTLQLGASSRQNKVPPPPIAYNENKNQILSEGQLLSSKFIARLKRVLWGYYERPSNPACLLVLEVNFKPKNGGFFRYRDATVEVQFDGGEGDRREDLDEQDDYSGPYVVKIYPELITGKVKTAMEDYGFTLEVNAAPLPLSAGGKYSFSAPKEGRSLVHGTTEGYLERSVEWKIRENNITGSGIEPQYTLAAIIAIPKRHVFNMVVRIKATTFANVPVKGRETSPIYFTPTASQEATGLGGLVTYGQRAYAPKPPNAAENEKEDLNQIDLEAVTQMHKRLLA